jgi:hypothetical protein
MKSEKKPSISWEYSMSDVERHRPLLDMGIKMDTKGHSVNTFLKNLKEVERKILLIDKLDSPMPTSSYTTIDSITTSTTKTTTATKAAANIITNPTVHSQGRRNASPSMKSLSTNINHRRNYEKGKHTKEMHEFSDGKWLDLNVANDDHAFNTLVNKTQLESRYYLKEAELLNKQIVNIDESTMNTKALPNRSIITNDERLVFQHATLGKRKQKLGCVP